LEYLELGQVLVNGSSRLPYTYCKGSKHDFKLVQGSSVQSFSPTCIVQQPGASIRAVKNRDAAYYPEQQEN
jgi:hypothetical protein